MFDVYYGWGWAQFIYMKRWGAWSPNLDNSIPLTLQCHIAGVRFWFGHFQYGVPKQNKNKNKLKIKKNKIWTLPYISLTAEINKYFIIIMLKTRWRGRVWVCIRRFLSYSPLCNSATSHYSPSLLFIICNNNKIIKIINKNKKIKRQKSPFTCLIISYLRFAIGTDLGHKQRNLKFSAPTT